MNKNKQIKHNKKIAVTKKKNKQVINITIINK